MKIYYNEKDNEVILNKEGFADGRHTYVIPDERFPLGQLLIDYIELDFGKIIEDFKEISSLALPKTKNDIDKNISIISNFYEGLKALHPYFWDINSDVVGDNISYEKLLTRYVDFNKILSLKDTWFQERKNTETLLNQLSDNKAYLNEPTDILDSNKVAEIMRTILQQEIEAIILNVKLYFKAFNGYIQWYHEPYVLFKNVVNFCYSSEESAELNNLSPLQRYYVYQLSYDKKIKDIYLRLLYRINTIDDKVIDIEEDSAKEELLNSFRDEKQNDIIIYELYDVNPEAACYLELIKLLSNNIIVSKCKNCEKYFVNEGRSDTLYCDRLIGEDGKTCRDVGAMNSYRERIKDDPIMLIYNKVYKRNNARVRYKKMTQKDFLEWSEEARELRDKARSGVITYEEFEHWLNKEE